MSNLWEQYKKNCDMHIHNTSDTVFNAFSDALTIQGERILKNVMKSLKINRKRAQKICFCEMEEEYEELRKKYGGN